MQNVFPNLADLEGNSLLLCSATVNSVRSWHSVYSNCLSFQTKQNICLFLYSLLLVLSNTAFPYTSFRQYKQDIIWIYTGAGKERGGASFSPGLISHCNSYHRKWGFPCTSTLWPLYMHCSHLWEGAREAQSVTTMSVYSYKLLHSFKNQVLSIAAVLLLNNIRTYFSNSKVKKKKG